MLDVDRFLGRISPVCGALPVECHKPGQSPAPGFGEKYWSLSGFPSHSLESGGGAFFDRNIWPDSCVFRIQRQPFLKPGFAISLDGIDGAFRFANATVDAFVRVDDEHVLALVEAVHGAHVDAVHDFAANTALVDDEGQISVLSADRSGELIHVSVCPRGARSLVENGRTEDPRPLAESEHRGTGIQRPRGSCSAGCRTPLAALRIKLPLGAVVARG